MLPCPRSHELQSQTDRLDAALAWMTERKLALAGEAEGRLGSAAAEIFRVHGMMLQDASLRERLAKAIENEGLTAEDAVQQELEYCRRQFLEADSAYHRERAADIADIRRGLLERLERLIPALCCKDMTGCALGECRLGNKHILIAPELTPEMTILVDSHTVGFLVERGAPDSHAAILARGIGLPTISGIRHLCEHVPRDAEILIDADLGDVILNPTVQTLSGCRGSILTSPAPVSVEDPVPELQVMANVDRPASVREALIAKADGIGLSRTEIEPLAIGRPLTESEQTMRYQEMLEAMIGKPVYIRLFDLGSDKGAPWLDMPKENNPALGCRGARLLLAHPELLKDQARALALCSHRQSVHVVYPMIVDPEQFRKLRSLFQDAVADLSPGTLFHGPMFEVPAACLQAEELLEDADFGCIGTNDLIQYLLACDRTGDVRQETLPQSPALWRLIEHMAEVAERTGKPLSICGELAGNPQYTRRIIDSGIKAVSTSPRRIAQVRQAARLGYETVGLP